MSPIKKSIFSNLLCVFGFILTIPSRSPFLIGLCGAIVALSFTMTAQVVSRSRAADKLKESQLKKDVSDFDEIFDRNRKDAVRDYEYDKIKGRHEFKSANPEPNSVKGDITSGGSF